MSGGHFDYQQSRINDIAEEIEKLISNNADERGYTALTIEEFKKAVRVLQMGAVYAQRIDWLVSCDDGEDSFHERLEEELRKIN